MSMALAETRFEAPRETSSFHVAFTIVATALLAMILVPAAMLAISYAAGGAVTSTILLVYLFALLSNAPFAVTGMALFAGAIWALEQARLRRILSH